MKTLIQYTLYSFLLGLFFMFSACESELDDKHENNDAFTNTKIEYLFAQGTLKTFEINYIDWYNLTFRRFGTYLQTTARLDGSSRSNLYNIQSDLDRWSNHYVTRMSTLTEIDKIYNTFGDTEKSYYKPYIETNKIVKAYNTAIATDFFGSMPYSEAFTARNVLYGGTVIYKPKYDSQKDIYYSILDDLKSAADYLATAQITNAIEQQTFARQDILFTGDLKKWYKLANSLLLRYAMRISFVDEAKARTILSGIPMNDLILSNSDNAYIKISSQSVAPDGMWRTLDESHNRTNGYYAFAPAMMVNMMTSVDDPRLPVFFQPPSNDEGHVIEPGKAIVGYPASSDDATSIQNLYTSDEIMRMFGIYNSVTFRYNYYLPAGVAFTAAEVNFLLAEAASRGLISGSAKDYYNQGIILSVQGYYDFYINSFGTSLPAKDPTVLGRDISDGTLAAWIDQSTFNYDSSKALEQIATQKWIHFSILQPYEGWAEYRRLDYPVLDDDREKGVLLNKENMPVRLLYPSAEASMNTDNYNAHANENYINVRVWWDTK